VFDEYFGGGWQSMSTNGLFGEGACHSEDTDVLTPNGVKKWYDLNKGDYVYGMDKNGCIIQTIITDIHKFHYQGEMYLFKNRRFNLLVTPNHDVYFKKYRQAKFTKVAAERVYKNTYGFIKSSFDYTGITLACFDIYNYIDREGYNHLDYPQKSHRTDELKTLDIKLFMKLVGLYISEGSQFKTERGDYVQIRNSVYLNEICELLDKLELKYSIYEESKIVIFHRDLARYLLRCGEYAPNKKIPSELLNLNRDCLTELFNGLMMGDGSKRGDKYYTTSKTLVEQFMILCIQLGYNPKYAIKDYAGKTSVLNGREVVSKHDYYVINISKNPSGWFDNRQKPFDIISYDGTIWCYTTDTENFFTVRDGQATLSGNSGKTQMANTAIIFCVDMGLHALVVETETNTINIERLEEIAKARGLNWNPELVHIYPSTNVGTVFGQFRGYIYLEREAEKNGYDVGLIIVDSFNAKFRRAYAGREMYPARAQEFGRHIDYLEEMCKKFNAAVLLTFQCGVTPDPGGELQDKMKYHGSFYPVGGTLVLHNINTWVSLQQKGGGEKSTKSYHASITDHNFLPSQSFDFIIDEYGVRDL